MFNHISLQMEYNIFYDDDVIFLFSNRGKPLTRINPRFLFFYYRLYILFTDKALFFLAYIVLKIDGAIYSFI